MDAMGMDFKVATFLMKVENLALGRWACTNSVLCC